ncbi:helix-turn-helix domain-containing protein [Nocardia cyriacigeorgica]|uniref:helix-turn-helix domain-containing protein n=1 Tax=Nocardia cyriacigeorgica TaxID=135487 RepID=UPI001487004A|nr:helix-turn-helix domain-containing protein [Nocardia cyriacigeorgica]
MLVAAAVSIIGNATQAILHGSAVPVVAAAVAVIPPLALLAAVHGVSVLVRADTGARATHIVATAMTAMIAAGAFWLSFTALRSLAVTAGVPGKEAWLWPLIIEGSMAQSTVALLALAHSAHPGPTARSQPESDDVPDSAHASVPNAPAATADEPMLEHVRTPLDSPAPALADFAALAELLCARDPAKRRDPRVVAHALKRHHNDGWTPTQIANELNKSRSTISRILSDAAAARAVHDLQDRSQTARAL